MPIGSEFLIAVYFVARRDSLVRARSVSFYLSGGQDDGAAGVDSIERRGGMAKFWRRYAISEF